MSFTLSSKEIAQAVDQIAAASGEVITTELKPQPAGIVEIPRYTPYWTIAHAMTLTGKRVITGFRLHKPALNHEQVMPPDKFYRRDRTERRADSKVADSKRVMRILPYIWDRTRIYARASIRNRVDLAENVACIWIKQP